MLLGLGQVPLKRVECSLLLIKLIELNRALLFRREQAIARGFFQKKVFSVEVSF